MIIYLFKGSPTTVTVVSLIIDYSTWHMEMADYNFYFSNWQPLQKQLYSTYSANGSSTKVKKKIIVGHS